MYANLVRDGVYEEWDKLERAVENKKRTAKVIGDGGLSDILNDEGYQSSAETSEKKLSSLTSAMETLRTEGKLTAEQMRDLQEEFPDVTNFTTDTIGK